MDDSQRRVSDALDALTAAVEDETLPNGVTWSLGYLRAWMEDRMLKLVPDETEYVLVPVAEVPTPEQRAAVGRIVDWLTVLFAMDIYQSCDAIEPSQAEFDAIQREIVKTRDAIHPGDIAAARAVAEGGTNG